MLTAVTAISAGAALGAVLRWGLGTKLNAFFPAVPPGTLAANLVGGYIAGVALGFLASRPGLSPEIRLFVITGFCGGLTTFSTFSAEIVDLLQKGQLAMGGLAIVVHVAGSVAMTVLGLATWYWVSSN